MVLIMPITPPDEGLIYSSSNVKLKINEVVIGNGVLYISESSLSWQGVDMNDGISIDWKQISLHGIATHPTKCIYFMLDHKLQWRNVYEIAGNDHANCNGQVENSQDFVDDANNSEANEGNECYEDDDELTECWLIAEDINIVETIFQAMKECQALHPDPADSVSDESDFMGDDENEEDDPDVGGDENGESAARHGINTLHINEQFLDADE